MNRWTTWVGLAVLTLGTASCAQTFDATKLGVPVTLAESAQNPVAGDTFRVTKHPVWFLWGLVPGASPNLQDVLAGQLGAGSRLANVRIHQRMEFLDIFATIITVGLVSPRSVTFEGVVVR